MLMIGPRDKQLQLEAPVDGRGVRICSERQSGVGDIESGAALKGATAAEGASGRAVASGTAASVNQESATSRPARRSSSSCS
ncbi:hypothetical protein ACFSR7_05995 [Cohnella sp. GCM10020058]|uniref:hypothetical protein n=1 Tax=Cohnella sp. GCM10020058 TaxID=3317330 RepID=UPI003632DE33